MITLFENFSDNYKNGDYVLLKHNGNDMPIELECLIINVHYLGKEWSLGSQGYCDIEVIDEDGDLITIDIDLDQIERKMTPEEIERYKLRKFSTKYNI
jgi:hypothetical protein